MKISDKVKALTKDQIVVMAMNEDNEDLITTLEIQFGFHAFDTNFKDIDIFALHRCLEQAVQDGELVL